MNSIFLANVQISRTKVWEMSEKVGKITMILQGTEVPIFHYKGIPFVSSTILKDQKRVTSYVPLYKRGIKSLRSGKYPELDKFFLLHRKKIKGNRTILFPLIPLANAEKDEDFEGIFKTDNFFSSLLAHFNFFNIPKETLELSSSEDEDEEDEYEDGSEEEPRVPRKNHENLSSTNEILLDRIKLLEEHMFSELRNMQSAYNQERAVQQLLKEPDFQNKAIMIAAKNILDEEGRTAILKEEEKRHNEFVEEMKKKEAFLNQSFQSALEHRNKVTEETRETLKRIKIECMEGEKQISALCEKKRKLRDEIKEVESVAEQRAEELRSRSYVATRASKGPVITAFMDSRFSSPH
jgi:hypothetical protein